MTRLDAARQALADARAERDARAGVTELSLFDPVDHDILDAAIARVEANAGPEWQAHVVDIVRQVAAVNATFTVDAIAELITEPVHDLRATGAAMRAAARAGIIRSTGTYQVSDRPQAHSRPVLIWESLIVGERRAS